MREDGGRNHLHMAVRVLFAGAAEVHGRIGFKPEFSGTECKVLVRKHERRRQAAIAERMGDGRQFDRFRPGANDQLYVGKTQSSPLPRREETASIMDEAQRKLSA
jgi:hypothetical protein